MYTLGRNLLFVELRLDGGEADLYNAIVAVERLRGYLIFFDTDYHIVNIFETAPNRSNQRWSELEPLRGNNDSKNY